MSYIDEVLGPGGVLSKALPAFVVRDGQLGLAEAIDRAFREGANLLAEAPTGCGKGYGYLVPAIFAAVGEQFGGRKVCVATANIALQEQLVQKDLPALASVLPWPFRFALAKGRANYLCRSRADDVAAEMVLAGPSAEREEFARVQAWGEQTSTGDLSELPFEVAPDLRRRLTVTADECVGKSCERHAECWANKAYRALPEANIVVTNYHLLLAHLVVMRATNGEAGILPSFDLLVCDECFPAGTRVLTRVRTGYDPATTEVDENGDWTPGSVTEGLRIEKLQAGDYVESYDEQAKTFGYRRIVRTMASKPQGLVAVTVGGKRVVCTPGHPFLTERGWIWAIDLAAADLVLSSEHAWARVEGVEVLEPGSDGTFGGDCPDGLVYNLEVEGTHTYLVTDEIDGLVVHNCHKLADIARDFLGFRVTPGSIRWAARLLAGVAKGKRALDPIDPDLKRRIDAEAEAFGTFLRTARRSPDYKARIREPLREQGWRRVADLLRQAEGVYLRTAAAKALPTGRKVEVIKQGVRAGQIAAQIEEALTVSNAEKNVYFIEEDDRGRVALAAKPISVADDLRAMLFGGPAPAAELGGVDEHRPLGSGVSYGEVSGYVDGDGARLRANDGEPEEQEEALAPRRAVKAVVGTSATIRTAASFGYIKRELGAENARELVAESPFDHYEQAILCFPADMPDPREREYTEAVATAFSEAVGYAKGRTLGLFTSYRMLAAAHERVLREQGRHFRVMRQGEAPRMQLVKAFREDVSSVLLGTESFAEGVDVPGEALSCLFIDKLPFAPPDDPVLDALQDAHPRDWFQRYSVPRAVISFRQRVGRLIRSVGDRGVIVCCDPRVLGKGYGRTFIRSLPEMRVSQKLSDIAVFLGQRPEERPAAPQGPRGPSAPARASVPASRAPAVPSAPRRLHRLISEQGQPEATGECADCGSTNAGVAEECPGPRQETTSPFAREVDAGLRAIVGAGRRRRSQAKEG